MSSFGNSTIPERLKSLGQPSLDALHQFVSSCSEDPNTRTIAVTSLVLSFWQLTKAQSVGTLPSVLLVGSPQKESAPIAKLAFQILSQNSDSTPREPEEGPFKHGTIQKAPTRMAHSIHRYTHFLKSSSIQVRRDACKRYRDDFYAAQKAAYGYGRSRPYADSWSEHFGLISEPDSIVALRLEEAKDIDLLKKHLRDGKTLLSSEGFGEQLALIPKKISLNGSLSYDQWDSETATKLVELGLPILTLLDHKQHPLDCSSLAPIEYLAMIWPNAMMRPILPASRLSGTAQNNGCYHHLRQRLSQLPFDYDYAILTLVRELFSLCYNLGTLAASHSPKESHPKVREIVRKLYDETIRGITLGVESLTWHGLGLATSHPPELIARTLQVLREKKTLSLRDLQRTAHIPSATIRDEILAALKEVGLVHIQNKTATAASFVEFSAGIHTRLK